MYSEMKKNIENSEAPVSRPTTFAPATDPRRKIENGMSGEDERRSIAAKPASSRETPAAAPPPARPRPPPPERFVPLGPVVKRGRDERRGGGREPRRAHPRRGARA